MFNAQSVMNSRRCHSSSFGFYLPHTPDPQVFGLFYFTLLFLSLPMGIQHITLGQFHNVMLNLQDCQY